MYISPSSCLQFIFAPPGRLLVPFLALYTSFHDLNVSVEGMLFGNLTDLPTDSSTFEK